jgi:hypothetical protein
MKDFILRQVSQIREGGCSTLSRKIKRVLVIVLQSPLYVMALFVVFAPRKDGLVVRVKKPSIVEIFCALQNFIR